MLMKQSDASDMKAMLDAFLRAVDEGDASPDILSEPNDATINELENGQTTHCSSYEDYISKI